MTLGEALYFINKEAKKIRDDIHSKTYNNRYLGFGFWHIQDLKFVESIGATPIVIEDDALEGEARVIHEEYPEVSKKNLDKLMAWLEQQNKLQTKYYRIKNEVLNSLNLTPIKFHKFGGIDGTIMALVELDGFTFHMEWEEDVDSSLVQYLGLISSKNELSEQYTIEEALIFLGNFLKKNKGA